MTTRTDARVLSTGRIVFIVIAAAAPMAAMVGNVPMALRHGNGAGLPSAFLIATAVLLCFAVGYAQMSRRVVNTGAFYTYVARALGKQSGVGAAYIAVVAYTSMTVGLLGGFSYFMQQVVAGLGITVHWAWFSVLGIAIVGVLGYRSVDLSARVLGVLMSLEFAVLVVFAVLVAGDRGVATLPMASFSPAQVMSGSLGVALMVAFTSFTGFESAALYSEEAKDPERAVARATYIAVSAVGACYILITWVIVGAVGPDQVAARATADGGVMVLNLVQQYGGEVLYDVAAVLLCTSVLASYSALHNAASRYLFALGRENVVPRILGTYHRKHLSPHIGSLTVTAITALAATGFAVAGADPYANFAAGLIGMGTLGIVALQALASVSVVAFFRRRGDRRLWQCVIAPTIGAVGLTVAFLLAAANYGTLTGSDSPFVTAAPLALVVAGMAGVLKARQLRRSQPEVYARIAASRVRVRRQPAVPAAAYTGRYCIVGAGPAGLVMARALLREGVPFDWFERHTDIGGLWDIDNPGSPMYESAHFISSKYTSGFVGFPMPDSFPDYPGWQQIRDYIRDFAEAYGLRDHVTLGVGVATAQPDGQRWRVRLDDGQERHYDGVIVCTGTNWHPRQVTLAGQESFAGTIRHSVEYRDPAEFVGQRVLIVGAGNSGVDIACDAARHADAAFLSVRRGYRFIPKHIFGLPTDAVLSGAVPPPPGVSLSGDANHLVDTLVGDLTRLGLPAPDHDVLQSHPIMNTQVLHHLAHGDLVAKRDVARLLCDEVEFADGSTEQVDHIVLATGYTYDVPFLREVDVPWVDGRPDLYLRLFPRGMDGLAFVGFGEFADAAYKRFEDMAHLVVMDIRLRALDDTRWADWKRTDDPDLQGGRRYVDSPRHRGYIDVDTYREYLAVLRDQFGWYDFAEDDYDALLVSRR